MRAAPAVQLDIETGAGWRVALWVLLVVTTASVVGWATTVNTAVAWVIVALVAAYAAALAWGSRTPRRARLGWDGAGWTLAETGGSEPRRGDVAVALDLGSALLLCFVPVPGPRWRARWIALEHTQTMPWHALRCALYSPRPAVAGEPG